MSGKTVVRRVLRGGSCDYGTWSLRTTYRYWFEPEFRVGPVGFRVVVKRVRRKR